MFNALYTIFFETGFGILIPQGLVVVPPLPIGLRLIFLFCLIGAFLYPPATAFYRAHHAGRRAEALPSAVACLGFVLMMLFYLWCIFLALVLLYSLMG